MAFHKLKNNAKGTVQNNPLSAAGTNLVVNAALDTVLNAIGAFPFYLTIWTAGQSPDTDPDMEIVEVTARPSTENYTIGRAKQGTTGVEHAQNSNVALLWTTGNSDEAIPADDNVQGAVYYVGSDGLPHLLAPGTVGQVLTTGGAAADPMWEDATSGNFDFAFTAGEDLVAGNNVGISANDTVKKIYAAIYNSFSAEQVIKSSSSTAVRVTKIADNKFASVYLYNNVIYARVGSVATDGTITFGAEVTIRTGGIYLLSYLDVCAIDTDKFVVGYFASNRGLWFTACTVSTVTITVGSEAPFAISHYCTMVKLAKMDTDKFASIVGDDYTTTRLGIHTVSGTTITVQAWASNTDTGIGTIGSAAQYSYDIAQVDANKGVIAYRKIADTYGYVKVFTVSTVTPTLGSETAFEAAAVTYLSVCSITSSLIAISYRVATAGKVIAATVSGTTPAFGTAVTFNSADTAYTSISGITSNQAVLAFKDVGDSNKGVVVGLYFNGSAISSSVISEVYFNNATTDYIDVAAIDSSYRSVIVYSDTGNGGYATAIIATSSQNLQRFIGIVQANVSSGNTASIRVAGIDANQSSLTAGSKYWVNTDGTLTTTDKGADLYVGVAKNATSIMLK